MNNITKIKTYWYESPNNRATVYFMYKDIGVCRLNINEGDNYGILIGLYVDKNHRNNGIATKLINSAEDELKNWNVKYMKLYVVKNTNDTDFLLTFYEKLGYEKFESSYSDEIGLLKKIN